MKYDNRFAAHRYAQLQKELAKRPLNPDEVRFMATHMARNKYNQADKMEQLAALAEELPRCANLHRLSIEAALTELRGEKAKVINSRMAQGQKVDYVEVLGFARIHT
jgi:hypothetical protein